MIVARRVYLYGIAFATIGRQHCRVGPFGRRLAGVVGRLHAPDHAAFFAAHLGNERQLLEPNQA